MTKPAQEERHSPPPLRRAFRRRAVLAAVRPGWRTGGASSAWLSRIVRPTGSARSSAQHAWKAARSAHRTDDRPRKRHKTKDRRLMIAQAAALGWPETTLNEVLAATSQPPVKARKSQT